MSYTPQTLTDLRPGLLANASGYSGLVANHNEVYEQTAPAIVDTPFGISGAAGVTDETIARWRIQGNQDLQTVRVRVRAVAAGGTATVTADVGGTSSSASVTVDAWYTIDITPPLGGLVGCSLRFTTPGGVTLSITRLQCYLVPSAPSAGRLTSGFVRKDSATLYAANEPVASEHVSRLLAGPIYIARERPVCQAMHLVRTNTTGTKSFANWQGYNSTAYQFIGRMRLSCARARRYVVDIYTLESGSGGQASITIGAAEVAITSMGGTTGTWTTVSLDLPEGVHEIRAAVLAGASNAARIAAIQVWRCKESY